MQVESAKKKALRWLRKCLKKLNEPIIDGLQRTLRWHTYQDAVQAFRAAGLLSRDEWAYWTDIGTRRRDGK